MAEGAPSCTPALVRSAGPGDSEPIAGLLGELGYPATVRDVGARLARLRQECDGVFVAEVGAEVVGFVGVHRIPVLHRDGDLARITALVVASRYRRQGVGQTLLEHVEQWARACACTRLEVTSGEHRSGAHRFYERLGYHRSERRFLKEMAVGPAEEVSDGRQPE